MSVEKMLDTIIYHNENSKILMREIKENLSDNFYEVAQKNCEQLLEHITLIKEFDRLYKKHESND